MAERWRWIDLATEGDPDDAKPALNPAEKPMDVVIGTHPTGKYETVPVPWPEGFRTVELHVAEVIEPSTFWSGNGEVLFASKPNFKLGACAEAIDWARARGHRVLGGEEAHRAIGAEPDPCRN